MPEMLDGVNISPLIQLFSQLSLLFQSSLKSSRLALLAIKKTKYNQPFNLLAIGP